MSSSHSSIVILVAEDDLGDQMLIQEVLQAGGPSKEIWIVNDGHEALEYLYRRGRYAGPDPFPRPDLILLDLNMPRLDGKGVLATLKEDRELKTIPVVAFTTSGSEEDVLHCYQMGVNSYVQKPTDFDRLQAVLHQVEQYWLEVSRLPPRAGHPCSAGRSPR